MVTPARRAQDIAARFSAAAYKPQVTYHRDHIRIETGVPESLSLDRWQALLAALECGDRFGLRGDADGRFAWAVVTTDACHHTDGGDVARRATDSSDNSPATAPPPGGWPPTSKELPT